MGVGGWLDQVRLKLTQSPTKVGVEVGTELGNYHVYHIFLKPSPTKIITLTTKYSEFTFRQFFSPVVLVLSTIKFQ